MSVANDIADAVTGVIQAANVPGIAYGDVARKYLEDLDLKSPSAAKVTVTPGSFESATLSRDMRRELYGIDVIVQRASASDGESDQAMTAIEQIQRLFEPAGKALVGYVEALWLRVERSPLFDFDRYSEYRQLAAVVRLTFQVIRQA